MRMNRPLSDRVAAGTILDVDANTPAGPFPDGSSWEDAYPFLETALDSALPGDEIRVAEDTYQPGQPGSILVGDQRTLTFGLKNDGTLKSGYAGYHARSSLSHVRDILDATSVIRPRHRPHLGSAIHARA